MKTYFSELNIPSPLETFEQLKILVVANDNHIMLVQFINEYQSHLKRLLYLKKCLSENGLNKQQAPTMINHKNSLIEELEHQLQKYFFGEITQFTAPYQIIGKENHIKIWRAVSNISYGKTLCYSEIGDLTSNGARSVAKIMGMNPLALLIPCHRVVRKSGNLGGFNAGMEIKTKLLDLEKTHLKNL
jgi:methylated-DNA-[protein]-cysteine S-methyltransferase